MKEVLWLNKNTLEEKYLESGSVIKGIDWVEVPEGATFATGDKDDFVFRKDGWYYKDGEWVKGNVTIKNLRTHKFVKLFWVKGECLWRDNNNEFTLERLLGCEVSLYGETGYICNTYNYYGGVVHLLIDECVVSSKSSYLKFFTEDGDELTFDEYVQLYYPKG